MLYASNCLNPKQLNECKTEESLDEILNDDWEKLPILLQLFTESYTCNWNKPVEIALFHASFRCTRSIWLQKWKPIKFNHIRLLEHTSRMIDLFHLKEAVRSTQQMTGSRPQWLSWILIILEWWNKKLQKGKNIYLSTNMVWFAIHDIRFLRFWTA